MKNPMEVKMYLDLMHKCYHDIMEDVVKIDFEELFKASKKAKLNPNLLYKEKCNDIWIKHYERFEKNVETIFGDDILQEDRPKFPVDAEA